MFRVLVDLAVGVQDVVKGLAFVVRIGIEDLLRPDLLGSESLGEFHVLP